MILRCIVPKKGGKEGGLPACPHRERCEAACPFGGQGNIIVSVVGVVGVLRGGGVTSRPLEVEHILLLLSDNPFTQSINSSYVEL